jgi:hypothetical protein
MLKLVFHGQQKFFPSECLSLSTKPTITILFLFLFLLPLFFISADDAWTHYNRAFELMDLGLYEDALKSFDKATLD